MKIIENGQWVGLSDGCKRIIREKVHNAAKIQCEKYFGTGPDAEAKIKQAAQRFEDALINKL
jgi:hypothetical protein